MIRMKIEGSIPAAAALEQLGDDVPRKVYDVTKHYGALLIAAVRANARRSFKVTTYDRQIEMRMGTGGIFYPLVEVGTNVDYGFRLERGFTGTDSLGRTYSQPPRPHFGPAVAKIGPRYEQAIARLFR